MDAPEQRKISERIDEVLHNIRYIGAFLYVCVFWPVAFGVGIYVHVVLWLSALLGIFSMWGLCQLRGLVRSPFNLRPVILLVEIVQIIANVGYAAFLGLFQRH